MHAIYRLAPDAERLRTQGVPFVVATGCGQVPELGPAEEVSVLIKPVLAQDLQRALWSVLAGPGA